MRSKKILEGLKIKDTYDGLVGYLDGAQEKELNTQID